MCLESTCSNTGCGKKTWWGCGGHIPSVMDKVPAGEECKCDKPKPLRPENAPAGKVHVHDSVE